MKFNYFYETLVNADIEIDDIGNCAIQAYTDMGTSYILLIRSNLGLSTIFTYGPLIEGADILPKIVNCKFERISYKENKLRDVIDKFLNNPYVKITSAIELDYNEALNKCVSITEYLKNPEHY